MGAKAMELTDRSFADAISEGITLVNFWAPWCKPCMKQTPIIREIAEESPEGVRVGKLNIDENRDTARNHSIESIPAVVVFREGKEVSRLIGVQSKEDLLRVLENAK